MAITHSIWRSLKSHATCKPGGCRFYKARVMGNRSLHCGNRYVGRFRLLWPWPRPWPDDLHLQTWRVLPDLYANCANMNFVRQVFWKLLYDTQTDRIYRNYVRCCFASGQLMADFELLTFAGFQEAMILKEATTVFTVTWRIFQ